MTYQPPSRCGCGRVVARAGGVCSQCRAMARSTPEIRAAEYRELALARLERGHGFMRSRARGYIDPRAASQQSHGGNADTHRPQMHAVVRDLPAMGQVRPRPTPDHGPVWVPPVPSQAPTLWRDDDHGTGW